MTTTGCREPGQDTGLGTGQPGLDGASRGWWAPGKAPWLHTERSGRMAIEEEPHDKGGCCLLPRAWCAPPRVGLSRAPVKTPGFEGTPPAPAPLPAAAPSGRWSVLVRPPGHQPLSWPWASVPAAPSADKETVTVFLPRRPPQTPEPTSWVRPPAPEPPPSVTPCTPSRHTLALLPFPPSGEPSPYCPSCTPPPAHLRGSRRSSFRGCRPPQTWGVPSRRPRLCPALGLWEPAHSDSSLSLTPY